MNPIDYSKEQVTVAPQMINPNISNMMTMNAHQKIENVPIASIATNKIETLEKRRFTDIAWLMVFILAWIGDVIIAYMVSDKAHPERLGSMRDSDGNICGITTNYENFPYVYFAAPAGDSFNKTVCVDTCPLGNETNLNCYPNSQVTSCRSNPDYNNFSNGLWIYETQPLFAKYCIPVNSTQFPTFIDYTNHNTDHIANQLSDLITSSRLFLYSILITLFIGSVVMVFLKKFPGTLTYIMIFGLLITILLFGMSILDRSMYYQAQIDKGYTQGQVYASYNNPQMLKIVAYVIFMIFLIFSFSLWWLWPRIRLAVAMIRISSEFIEDNLTVLSIPPIMFIITLGFLVYWLWIMMCIYSSGEIPYYQYQIPYINYEFDKNLKFFLYYHLIMLIWNTFYLIDLPKLIISTSICLWYFLGSKFKDSIGMSTSRVLKYHLGSIAIGSLVIGIISPFRLVINEINVKKRDQAYNFIQRCLRTFCNAFEKYIGYLNTNAYIQESITSDDFFPAALDNQKLVQRHSARFNIIGGIGNLYCFLSKLFISMVTTVISYAIISHSEYYKNNLHSSLFPTLWIMYCSYVLSSHFISLYSMTIDTMIHCYCVDEEINTVAILSKKALKDFIKLHIADRERLLVGQPSSALA